MVIEFPARPFIWPSLLYFSAGLVVIFAVDKIQPETRRALETIAGELFF